MKHKRWRFEKEKEKNKKDRETYEYQEKQQTKRIKIYQNWQINERIWNSRGRKSTEKERENINE